MNKSYIRLWSTYCSEIWRRLSIIVSRRPPQASITLWMTWRSRVGNILMISFISCKFSNEHHTKLYAHELRWIQLTYLLGQRLWARSWMPLGWYNSRSLIGSTINGYGYTGRSITRNHHHRCTHGWLADWNDGRIYNWVSSIRWSHCKSHCSRSNQLRGGNRLET